MNINFTTPITSQEFFLAYAHKIWALEFSLEGIECKKSKRISPYSFNYRMFYTGSSITHLAKACSEIVKSIVKPDVVFGLAYKWIPLATAIAQALWNDTWFAFNRKEEKTYAEWGLLLGSSISQKNILITDNVIKTGKSFKQAVDLIIKNDGIPIACIIPFYRQERRMNSDYSSVQEFELSRQIPVLSAAKLTDLISFLERSHKENCDNKIYELYETILKYKIKYWI